jgi:phosphoglycolate phosphatase-like HAD superfamily hydrolase
MSRDSFAFVALDWNGTVVPFFGLPPFTGALEQVRRLRRAGLPVFVVSCAEQATIEADVARVGVTVDGVYGCTDKAPVFSRLRLQHGAPGVVLGDHPADLRAAQAADLGFYQARLDSQANFAGAEGAFERWDEVATLLLAGVHDAD